MELGLRVAVVGAGAAGLVALRHLNTHLNRCKISAVAFEQSSQVGGTWFYTESTGVDENGLPIHSSMYKNLRTNLPKECMAFPDFPFPENLPSFVRHDDVQKYLEDYTTHFKLWDHIKFHRKVNWIQPVAASDSQSLPRWEVTSCDVRKQGETTKDTFDAVLVCNGHYALPLSPDLPGQDSFTGEIIHSHNYREPEVYRDKTVVLLGANSSGQDIAVELSKYAKKVILSHNKPPLKTKVPENMFQKPGISRLEGDNIFFQDGSSIQADTLMLCTGYHYDFSFISPDTELKVDDERVTPLYKHFLHSRYPNFGIIGICKVIIPFPHFDIQAQYFRAVLTDQVTLPDLEARFAETQRDYEDRLAEGMPHRHAHVLSDRQFEYNDELADLAGVSRIPSVQVTVYRMVHDRRRQDLVCYKNENIHITQEGDEFKVALR